MLHSPILLLVLQFTVVTDNKYNIELFFYNAKKQGTETWTNFLLPCYFVSLYQHFVHFTQLGLEPTIFRTRGEHAYHYNNDQVIFI
jgi:hypothetical protein